MKNLFLIVKAIFIFSQYLSFPDRKVWDYPTLYLMLKYTVLIHLLVAKSKGATPTDKNLVKQVRFRVLTKEVTGSL